jgi:hypothetical protein
MPECRTAWHPVSPEPEWKKRRHRIQFGTGIRVPQSGTGMLQYRTELLDASGIDVDADAHL